VVLLIGRVYGFEIYIMIIRNFSNVQPCGRVAPRQVVGLPTNRQPVSRYSWVTVVDSVEACDVFAVSLVGFVQRFLYFP